MIKRMRERCVSGSFFPLPQEPGYEARKNCHKMPTGAQFSIVKVVIINILKSLSLTDTLSGRNSLTPSQRVEKETLSYLEFPAV